MHAASPPPHIRLYDVAVSHSDHFDLLILLRLSASFVINLPERYDNFSYVKVQVR
jgi:hypothetical protein